MTNFTISLTSPNEQLQDFGGFVKVIIIANTTGFPIRYRFGDVGGRASATDGNYLPSNAVNKVLTGGQYLSVAFDSSAGTGVTGTIQVETEPKAGTEITTGAVTVSNLRENQIVYSVIDSSSTTTTNQYLYRLYDNNLTTYCTCDLNYIGRTTANFTLDLGSVRKGYLNVLYGVNGASTTAILQVSSDAVTWTNVDTLGSINTDKNFTSNNITLRYLRLVGNKNAGDSGDCVMYEAGFYL